jgi:hypothetical protein
MKMLPLASFVMSHFEIELFFEHLTNWRILVHLPAPKFVRPLWQNYQGEEPKIELDGFPVPIDVRYSIFNEILPIRDWVFHLNDGYLNIRTQAWVISAKD